MNQLHLMRVIVLLMSVLAGPVLAQSGGNYEITKSTIDSGGGTADGGDYSLSGTIGQPDAATLVGGGYELNGGFWQPASAPPGCPCTTAADCKDTLCAADNACNCVSCAAGVCVFTCTVFGNVECSGGVSLDDILCSLAGFANFAACHNGDISPCGGNGILNLDDILAVLNAFGGGNPCGCLAVGAPDLCGSSQP